MPIPHVGSYVTHEKMAELGSGEVVASDGLRVTIRFSTGERNFVYALVEKHLKVTAEAPAARPTKQKAGKAPRASKKAPA